MIQNNKLQTEICFDPYHGQVIDCNGQVHQWKSKHSCTLVATKYAHIYERGLGTKFHLNPAFSE